MPNTLEFREHKKRQRHRNQERRQLELESLLSRITPVEQSPLYSSSQCGDLSTTSVADLYRPIPPLSSPETFWDKVPEDCNPSAAVMDSRIVSQQTKFAIHQKISEEKLKKKLTGRVRKGHITKEEEQALWEQHRRKKKMRKENAADEEGVTLLSASRGQRKAWQVENFVALLQDSLKPGMTVIDFGCGSGNLCLALAAYFPQVNFVLVDKKPYPLQMVKSRAELAGLKNVKAQEFTFSPENLKSYEPPNFQTDGDATEKGEQSKMRSFDLGIGLHCCGSFTDMVMELCLLQSADCIVSPCCNGGMTSKATGGYNYPRSSFLQHCVSEEEYLQQLSRGADDMRVHNYKAKCWVEYDRALWAKEHGFSKVDLWKMTPLESTPKHHILYLRK